MNLVATFAFGPDLLILYSCSWRNDVFVVAEPGELAEKFLQSVKLSLLSTMRSHRRKGASLLSNVLTVSDLVALKPYFEIGGIVHRYLGRQTQVCYLGIFLCFLVISCCSQKSQCREFQF